MCLSWCVVFEEMFDGETSCVVAECSAVETSEEVLK